MRTIETRRSLPWLGLSGAVVIGCAQILGLSDPKTRDGGTDASLPRTDGSGSGSSSSSSAHASSTSSDSSSDSSAGSDSNSSSDSSDAGFECTNGVGVCSPPNDACSGGWLDEATCATGSRCCAMNPCTASGGTCALTAALCPDGEKQSGASCGGTQYSCCAGGQGSSSGSSTGSSGGSSSGTPYDGSESVVILATSQSIPTGIAVTSSGLAWTNRGSGDIVLCTLPACTSPAAIASGESSPGAIVASGSTLFWIAGGNTLRACTLPGCSKSTPSSLATVVAAAPEHIEAITAGTLLNPDAGVGGVTVDVIVYSTSSGGVYACTAQPSACTPRWLFGTTDGGAVPSLAVQAMPENVYAATPGGIVQLPQTGAPFPAYDTLEVATGASNELYAADSLGNIVLANVSNMVLASGQEQITALLGGNTVGMKEVYWIRQADGGSINRWASSLSPVQSTLAQNLPSPQALAEDATFVYFTDSVAGLVGRVNR